MAPTLDDTRVRTDVPNPFDGAFWLRPMGQIDADLAVLRAEGPVFVPELEVIPGLPPGPGGWVVSNYDDIVHISRHPELFSNAQGIGITDLPGGDLDFPSIIDMDDPRHARLRRIVSKGFTPRMLALLEESVQKTAREIVDGIIGRGEVDFVVDVAATLPLKIVCDLMGIPDDKLQFVFDRTNVVLGAGDPEYTPEGTDFYSTLIAAATDLVQLMDEVAESKRGGDGTDLTSLLVNADLEDDRLTHNELGGFFILLVVAGNETTRNAMSWGLHLLTQNPDQMKIWQNDFEGVAKTAVEEIVRVASPVTYMRRTTTQDTEVNGRTIKAGDKLGMFYLAANRDEAVFEDPYRFDVRRTPNNHLGFGGPGPHFCLGAHLARREMTVMFRELFDRIPDIRATGDPVQLRSSFIHGVKHLPAAFTPGGVR